MATSSPNHAQAPALIELHTTGSHELGNSLSDPNTDVNPGHSTASAAIPLELTFARKLKLISALLCFFNCGVNDGSLGALIPYILRTYNISTGWMAIPYGVTFLGWLIAAFLGGYGRIVLGSGGMIIFGGAVQLLAQCFRPWVPPFSLFSVTFFLVALGQASQEPQCNTFVSRLKNAHRWLGLLHGCYAIGGLTGPLVAAAIASHSPADWAYFYLVPMGFGVVNLGLSCYTFRDETTYYQKRGPRPSNAGSSSSQRRSAAALVEFKATIKQKSVWLLSIFFFLYLGAAITAGGWVVEYLATVRHGSLSRVGFISAAFYGGLAAGRFALAEPTFRFGEKRMFLVYAIMSLVLQIIFWRVPNVIVDSTQVMISLMGFLLGPAFATGISVGSKLIPVELQPSGLAMIFVMAQAGGAIFPAITGVIADSAGVSTLQPILVGLLFAMAISWMLVPDPKKLLI
ncbi:hypothetical protein LTR78_002337 [Recurvomyces mirabilis]|uniref:Major facilitator superfamily (MFS) profile domain-containing protein n=1 Tax=Recurvomyces mirabilis TaxID=574656 RepID=A0AAE1C464_9PEZI|nr:hypothetical protein LTR78_002337 [Recurvomyces mirabilis]KAK5157265.1 hypothetical protein LTS14_004030 [Recurvomyces mirabilis]